MTRRSPLAMVVLSLLAEGPMHPYRMQQLIKERHKDEVVNVAQRNSVYQTIDRLLRAGLVGVAGTARAAARRPERTVYEITTAGLSTLHTWLREMLAVPSREFPDYPAALAFLPILSPDDALAQLRARAATLAARLDAATTSHREASWLLPVFLVEDEYRIAMLRAELDWTRSLIARLESGEIAWDRAGRDSPSPAS